MQQGGARRARGDGGGSHPHQGSQGGTPLHSLADQRGAEGPAPPVTLLQTGCGKGAAGPGMWERKTKYACFPH